MKKIELEIRTADPVYVQIERFLRRQILTGRIGPSEQLPSTNELVRQLQVNRASVIKAMAHLRAEGLIDRKPKRGTFVKSSVDRSVIGVLIGENLSDETSYFQRAVCKHLREELMSMQDRYWTYRVYDGLFGLDAQTDFRQSPMFQNLSADLRNYPFKGMIQVLGGLSGTQASYLAFNLPTVRLGPPYQGTSPEVIMDYYRFGRESVEFAVRRGLRKIFYLRAIYEVSGKTVDLDGVDDAVRALKLGAVETRQLHPAMIGGPHLEQAGYEQARALVEEWNARGENGWPEVLLISDDIAARGVARSLADHGGEAARKLMVLVMANKEIVHHYLVPVMRYEFSIKRVAHELLDVLWKRIVGEPLPDLPVKIEGNLRQ
ncbi:MAG: GntR family transcriptional regulator [Verrucomicrobiae bacterium]|nr:GntR family transcriptional regulator [Verrucomicrobiae bacterium]